MSREPLRTRDAYPRFVPITTRWADNDMYGHANNVVYYSWFDTAVNTWLIEAGLLDLAGGNPIGLVVETGCRYAASVGFPQKLEIGVRVAKLGSSSVTYHLGVFVAGETEPAAEGHFTHVYVDSISRRPTPLPEAWRAALKTLA
ncbi:thioesterase [Sphingomonas panacis]|uniref:Thioesterase n=1 Tax=Sphingomonas panacis TaxID=1560345 RepID=A0A1B3Z792_9SPHN|nr:thioesterase family protein [Sphingomonas panacis]AOH83304.1 thioesterase [Sphingomonas panacis]